MLFDELLQEFKEVMKNNYGSRINEGKCAFCGAALSNGQYCGCNGAEKINRYFKKFHNKFYDLQNYADIGSDLKDYYTVTTPKKFAGLTFEDYRTTDPNAGAKQKVLKAVKDYYANCIYNYLSGTNLLLIGNYGTGKTMLASILCRQIAAKCFNCKFINIVDLFEEITATFYGNGKVNTTDYINRYKKADFLFLDDIDKREPTDYIKQILYSVVNYRVENELPVVISANAMLNELEQKFGEAIISRLVEKSRVVLFEQANERLV